MGLLNGNVRDTLQQAMRSIINGMIIVGMIVASITWLDGRYAKTEDISVAMDEIVQTVRDLRCRMINEEMQELQTRQEYDNLQPYENVRLSTVERRWKMTCAGENAYGN